MNGALTVAAAILLAFACALTQGCASAPAKAPCDPVTAAKMAASCAAASELCVRQGLTKETCPARTECIKAADARQAECLQ